MIHAIFYANRDNSHDLQLTESGAIINHALITRAVIEFDGGSIDSQTSPSMFTLGQSDRITLKLGASTDMSVGTHTARLVVYDASHPNGIVWTQLQVSKVA